jgi:hypothetical protein
MALITISTDQSGPGPLIQPLEGDTVSVLAGVTLDATSGDAIIGALAEDDITVTIAGDVLAAGAGVSLDDGDGIDSHEVTVALGGSITSGTGEGVGVIGDDTTVTNAGSITSTAQIGVGIIGNGALVTNQATGVIAATGIGGFTQIAVFLAGDDNRLENAGFITSANDLRAAVEVFAEGNARTTIVNTGTITGNGTAIGGTGQFTVENAGTITGDITFGTPLAVVPGFDAHELTNTGTIDGSVSVTPTPDFLIGLPKGDTRFVNSGSVTGDVTLAGGDDLLDISAGSIAGTVTGGAGDDVYVVTSNGIVFAEAANEGFDVIEADFSVALVNYPNFEGVILSGGADLTAQGDALANLLAGNAGANTLTGGEGDDTLRGGAGDDSIDGGLGTDVLDFASDAAVERVVVNLSGATRYNVASNAARDGHGDIDTLGGIEAATGTVFNDTFVGSDMANTFSGGDGIDLILAEDGDDVLDGGADNDRLYGGRGEDMLTGGAGDDSLFGSFDDDMLTGGAGTDRIAGGTGRDTFGFVDGFDEDRILDYNTYTEKLDFTGHTGVTAFGDLSVAETAGSAVVTDADGNRIVLVGVAAATISEGDFIF